MLLPFVFLKPSGSLLLFLWERTLPPVLRAVKDMLNNRGAMMRPLVGVLLALVSLSLRVQAGELYGSIADAAKPVGAGIKVEITVAGKSYTAETDRFGAYRIYVKEKGKGVLTVRYKGQSPSADLFSYERSTRYDWVLDTEGGKLTLRRK
jgi:hypothetical protein